MKSSCKSRDGWINNQHIQRQRKSAERIYGGFGWLEACIGRYKALPTNYADYQQKHFQDSLKDKFKRLGHFCRYLRYSFLNQIRCQTEPLYRCELWTTMCCFEQNITFRSIFLFTIMIIINIKLMNYDSLQGAGLERGWVSQAGAGRPRRWQLLWCQQLIQELLSFTILPQISSQLLQQ